MPKSGYFFDTIVRQDPIDESRLNPEDNLEEFDDISDGSLAYISSEVKRASTSGCAIIGGVGGTGFGDIALVPAPFLKHPKGIRDVSEWYVSTLARTDYIHSVFSTQCDIAIRNLERLFETVGNDIDILFVCGTDFGTQDSSFCSTETFIELYFPYYKQINDWVHQHTDWKTFKHSCGAIDAFMPHFIDAGFDIINPVQCSAAGMDPEHLKSSYGENIVFWGGGVDTQQTLPFGSPRDVRAEVTERCRIFSRDSGFVFNTIHNIQARTPVENIVAMLDAIWYFDRAGA
jgi:uroporphyrinogen-III decarboxylase